MGQKGTQWKATIGAENCSRITQKPEMPGFPSDRTVLFIVRDTGNVNKSVQVHTSVLNK